eukprot:3618388-Alexandrium_andersonii.AAC.1
MIIATRCRRSPRPRTLDVARQHARHLEAVPDGRVPKRKRGWAVAASWRPLVVGWWLIFRDKEGWPTACQQLPTTLQHHYSTSLHQYAVETECRREWLSLAGVPGIRNMWALMTSMTSSRLTSARPKSGPPRSRRL